jgi:hypothetical protein
MKKGLLVLVALSITNFANADGPNFLSEYELYPSDFNEQETLTDEDFNTNSSIKKANNFYQASNGNYYDVSGIGYGIDTIKGTYGSSVDIKISNNIFDSTFLDNQIADGNVSVMRSCDFRSESSNSMSELETKYASNLDYSSSVSLDVPLFASKSLDFSHDYYSIEYSNYINSYFYHAYNCIASYNFTLPGTTDLSTYKDNLSSYYVYGLDDLFDGTIDYNDFFDIYGTHVVSKANYGGAYEIYYSASSNGIDLNIDADEGSEIDSKLRKYLGCYSSSGTSTSFEYDINDDYGVSTSNTKDYFRANFRGGSVSPGTCLSINYLSSAFGQWGTSYFDSPAMIKMTNLIPLWNLLPSKYDDSIHKQILEDYFLEYAEENAFDVSIYDNETPTTSTSSYTARTDQIYNVSSSDKFLNSYDTIDLKETEYSPELLSDHKFNRVKVSVTLNMNEITDGWETVYLYSDEIGNDAYKIASASKSCGKLLVTNQTYADYEYIFYLPISAITDEEKLIIRYGGTGAWNNTNIRVKISYSIC